MNFVKFSLGFICKLSSCTPFEDACSSYTIALLLVASTAQTSPIPVVAAVRPLPLSHSALLIAIVYRESQKQPT